MFYKAEIIVVVWLLSILALLKIDAQTVSNSPVSYSVRAPEEIKVGDMFTVDIIFSIRQGWYVYAPIEMNSTLGKIPTEATFKTPECIVLVGALILPDENEFFDRYWGNDIKMSQKFRVEKCLASSKQTIMANIVYQTCNDDICYPPVRNEINIVITVKE